MAHITRLSIATTSKDDRCRNAGKCFSLNHSFAMGLNINSAVLITTRKR